MRSRHKAQILELARSRGLLRASDLAAHEIPRSYLSRMCEEGQLTRRGRGLYSLPDADFGEHEDLVEVCRRVPHGVVALMSALAWHNLTTQIPHTVTIAIDHKARMPAIDYPALEVVRVSQPMLYWGVERAHVQQMEVRVYSVARTVIDCFRFRRRLGMDVAMEALRECRRRKAASVDELWEAAQACRISSVIRPYLEATS